MEVKPPVPQVPPPVWTEFKDLQEFEKYRNDPRFKELTDSVDVTKLSKTEGWKHDIELLMAEVRRMHKDPDRTIAFAEFDRPQRYRG